MFGFYSAFVISVILREILVYIDSTAWPRLALTNEQVLDVESSEFVIPADDTTG
jgi:hypothetical protein